MKLKDFCIGITDGSHNPPPGIEIGDYYMISSKNVFDDLITLDEPRYLTEEQFLTENKRTNITSGDVLMTIVGTVGRAAVVTQDIERITLQRSVAVLHPKKDICNSRYLMYVLRSKRTFFANEAHGVAQKGIYLKQLSDIDIDLPALDEQITTVDMLDRVNKIIKCRQKQLDLFDELIKARFVEMFGNPIRNEKGFETKSGEDVFKLSNGKFVPEHKRLESGIPVYGGNGISWFTDEILSEEDTVVVGRVGFQSGNVHLAEGPLWISDNAMYISNLYDSGYDLRFLYWVMEHIDFTRYQDAGDLKKITQKPFMQMKYIKPPISMQHDYNAFVDQVDKSKVVAQKALDKAQVLFDSLIQQYFG